MYRTRITKAALMAALIAPVLGLAACSRSDEQKAPPTAQIATQTPEQTLNQPMTVDGCLRAGDGTNTFVLTTAQTETGAQPATYQLVGAADVNLADHVGERITATGVLQAQQQASTQTPPAPADKATGTSGTPTVQTQTTLTVRTLDVSSVKSLGERCDK